MLPSWCKIYFAIGLLTVISALKAIQHRPNWKIEKNDKRFGTSIDQPAIVFLYRMLQMVLMTKSDFDTISPIRNSSFYFGKTSRFWIGFISYTTS